MRRLLLPALALSSLISHADIPGDEGRWERGHSIREPRANLYELLPEDFAGAQARGELHTQLYPVSITGLVVPFESLDRFFRHAGKDPFRRLLALLGVSTLPFRDFQGLYEWMGLSPYFPARGTRHELPRPSSIAEPHRVGAAMISTPLGPGMSFSCLACHASEFFGRTVVGLPNKRSRANTLFVVAKRVVPPIDPRFFRSITGALGPESAQYARTRERLQAVRPLKPLSLGLDTSLAHVGRSLAARGPGPWAPRDRASEKHPVPHELDHLRSDSKPMPWWTLKYKNRWLSDGSVVSGNPILTNLLWNELGRGTDLEELDEWISENGSTIRDLGARVFATEPPRYTDYFPASRINLASAQRGERLFQATCAGCHGNYEKRWNERDSDALSPDEKLATARVRYPSQTRVIDVGTEASRRDGMTQLANQLNGLEISRRHGIVVEPQSGYVPPPLEGIFARYPYLHNASVPNLCALLTPAPHRPRTFVAGPARSLATDFDADCVGYPTGDAIPADWRLDLAAFVDTRVEGRQPLGHDEMLLHEDGRERFEPQEKRDLIEFLKTL